MLRARAAHAGLLGLALTLSAGASAADDEPEAPTTEVIAIDVGSLPSGQLPAPAAETDAPKSAPAWTEPATITVTPAGETTRTRRPKRSMVAAIMKKSIVAAKRAERVEKVKLVSIAPTTPSLDSIYTPSTEATDFEGQDTQKMSCGDRASLLPMRWEALTTQGHEDARLSVQDLWFDAKACTVGPGAATTLPLKAIAWDGEKPWLYAMRSAGSVTIVMPRVSEINSESMVGAPVSMRGAFTRISMPLGRWGSSSIVAQVDSLGGTASGDGADRPVEVGIELVQTMSEKSPTLLVRTRRASPATAAEEGRD